MSLKYNNKVKVIYGFYEGLTGQVIDERTLNNTNVEYHVLLSIQAIECDITYNKGVWINSVYLKKII